MWLVVCAGDDAAGWWVAQALSAAGLDPLRVVTDEDLATASHWSHSVSAVGCDSELRLNSGAVIRAREVRGVLNRLHVVRPRPAGRVSAEDLAYADQELNALATSWLASLPNVVNRPVPPALSGVVLRRGEWAALAVRAAIPVMPYERTDTTETGPEPAAVSTAFVIDGCVLGPPAIAPHAEACARLAALAGVRLLAVEFAASTDGAPAFVGASAHPDIARGGAPLLARLAVALRGPS